MHVEDHPIEYGTFEGTIPQGEYGGGTVMLWDRGSWEPLEDPRAGHQKGHLKFLLHGERLKGKWSLVRIGGRGSDGTEEGDNWLLIKGQDDYASKDDALAEDTSVDSGRTMEEIAGSSKSAVWNSNREPAKKTSKVKERFAKAAATARRPVPVASANGRGSKLKQSQSSNIDPSTCTHARRAAQPKEFFPQLATLVSKVPAGQEWVHELKLDGYRLLCFLEDGKARLVTRNGNDWSHDFPTITWALERLPVKNAILDGEAVVLRPDGATDFQALQNAAKDRKLKTAAIRFFLFDLPYCEGFDLTRSPLVERKKVLKDLLTAAPKESAELLPYSEHVEGEGTKVFKAACSHAMEGVVSKQADSPYEQRRTKSWLKTKCTYEQEFVIGGFSDPNNSRKGFGALLLGFYEGDDLIYAGRVGTGFTDASLGSLHKQLAPLETSQAPFANPPRGYDAKGVHWVRPKLVAEVEFNEWTREGILRHPSFKGLRSDKNPEEIVREMPDRAPTADESAGSVRANSSRRRAANAKTNGSVHVDAPSKASASPAAPTARTKRVSRRLAKGKPPSESDRGTNASSTVSVTRAAKAKAQIAVAGVNISNPNRVLYPEQGITKGELALFYESISDFALPHMSNRPLSLVRCPEGRQAQCFYQKHINDRMPAGIGGVPIREKTTTREYVYIKNLQGLIGMVQMGVLEIHPWGCRVDDIEKPDRLIFDLDPGPGVEWSQVIAGVKRLREMLKAVKLESFLKTSGGKGLHVFAPIARTVSWDQLKEFSEGIVIAMTKEEPTKYLTVMTKAKRKGKIFLDYLRNGRGATCVAAYSTRAREDAPVSTPIFWEELNSRLRPDKFTVRNLPDRLRSEKDPWANFLTLRQTLTTPALRAVAELAKS